MRGRRIAAAAACALLAAVATPGPDAVVTDLAVPYGPGLALDVVAPARARGAPVVVTVHGCCGGRHDLTPLAHALAQAGLVVVNASFRTVPQGGGWPGSYQDVACAAGWARARARAYGGDPRRVTLVGWADGALIAGVTVLSPESVPGGCGPGGARPRPADALVAVGGFVGWPAAGGVPEEQVNERTVEFFGAHPEAAPAAWQAGNPWAHLGRRSQVAIRLVAGRVDPVLAGNRCFAAAARAAGHGVRLVVAPDAGGQTVIAPRTPEGRLTVAEIVAAARAYPPSGGEPGTCPQG